MSPVAMIWVMLAALIFAAVFTYALLQGETDCLLEEWEHENEL